MLYDIIFQETWSLFGLHWLIEWTLCGPYVTVADSVATQMFTDIEEISGTDWSILEINNNVSYFQNFSSRN